MTPSSLSAEPPRSLPKHFPALDGVRGIAILLVVASHFFPGNVDVGPIFSRLLPLAGLGWAGVDLFFVLSGFLITGILFDTRASSHYFRNFYMRRALRIFPLYYGTLFLVFFVAPGLNYGGISSSVAGNQAWFWLYGVNILASMLDHSFPFFHFWSLAVEEQFYMVWPFLVVACRRERLMKICGLIIILAPLMRWFAFTRWGALAAYCLTPCRIDALALGGLAALAIRGPGGIEPVVRFSRRAALVLVPSLLALFIWKGAEFITFPWIVVFGYSLVDAVSCCLVLASISETSRVRVLLDNALLKSFGKYSYGIYVLHVFVMGAFERVGFFGRATAATGSPTLAVVGLVLGGSALSFAVAFVSWHLFEKHFLTLKRWFEDRTPRASQVS
jgi:peptidoglycan/LPS O-acetylase OafA/YrhL